VNTGLRRGELLALRWESIDFSRQILTVEGGTAKSRQTRHVPLNDEAIRELKRWHEQANGGQRVFESRTSFKSAWASLLKRAKITKFRWHDLRHHFGLVQGGVPLNTVRDLLGHSSVAMSLRYAHLAPDQRREAVARLRGSTRSESPRLRCAYSGIMIPLCISILLILLVVREGLEPDARSCVINKLLIYITHLSPGVSSNPRIWHSIWHWPSVSQVKTYHVSSRIYPSEKR
jgi:hypothetical protein